MVVLLRPRTVYLKSNECALFSVSSRCDFSVSSSPYCKGILPERNYRCWAIFVEASIILSQSSLSYHEILLADTKLIEFCKMFEDI